MGYNSKYTGAQVELKLEEVERLKERIAVLEKFLPKNYVSEDLTSSVISGYYTYSSTNVGEVTTPTRNYGGGWRCIAQAVRTTERYTITGTGGGGARLYCIVNSAGVIKAIAGSDETQSGLVLNVEEDGMLYCSFNNSENYQLIREYLDYSLE